MSIVSLLRIITVACLNICVQVFVKTRLQKKAPDKKTGGESTTVNIKRKNYQPGF